MRLIERYLLRQLLGPVVLATLALTGVALLSQSLSGLDLIVNQRQSALVFLKVTLLAMPQLINMILPIALFVAALVALNRLHTEQEIVVCGMAIGHEDTSKPENSLRLERAPVSEFTRFFGF